MMQFPHLRHVAHVSSGDLVPWGSWRFSQNPDGPPDQIKLTQNTAKEGGLATPTGAKQTVAACKIS